MKLEVRQDMNLPGIYSGILQEMESVGAVGVAEECFGERPTRMGDEEVQVRLWVLLIEEQKQGWGCSLVEVVSMVEEVLVVIEEYCLPS